MTNPTPSAADRAAFEKWWNESQPDEDSIMGFSWRGWQAALAAEQERTRRMEEALNGGLRLVFLLTSMIFNHEDFRYKSRVEREEIEKWQAEARAALEGK